MPYKSWNRWVSVPFFFLQFVLRNDCRLWARRRTLDRWTMLCVRAATECFKCHWLMPFSCRSLCFPLAKCWRNTYVIPKSFRRRGSARARDQTRSNAVALLVQQRIVTKWAVADAPISKIKYVQLINCCIFAHQNVVELIGQHRSESLYLCRLSLWCEFQFVAHGSRICARTHTHAISPGPCIRGALPAKPHKCYTISIINSILSSRPDYGSVSVSMSGHSSFVCDFSCVFRVCTTLLFVHTHHTTHGNKCNK